MKDLESFHGGNCGSAFYISDGGNSTFINSFDKTNFFVVLYFYLIFMIIKLKLFPCSIFDLQSCSPDPLLPSVLERTPAEEVDLANEEDRGLFRIHSLFSIYSVQQVSG